MNDIVNAIINIKENNKKIPLFIGISGIDASGKGYISKVIKENLINLGYSVHIENLDGWLDLPEIRFSKENPSLVFYEKGFRWSELENQLLKPYFKSHKVHFSMNYLEETWTSFELKERYIDFVDFFILEGIFIFQQSILPYLQYKIWIDCTFETALKRALARNQEGLSEIEIINSYKTIFFPAQEIHITKDQPKQKADIIYNNE
jgi:uridine kinase